MAITPESFGQVLPNSSPDSIEVEVPQPATNSILWVAAGNSGGSVTATIDELGAQMTEAYANTTGANMHVWYYLGIAPGTYNVSLSASAHQALGYGVYFGVDQDNPLGTADSAAGQSGSDTRTVTSEEGQLVIDFAADTEGNLSPNINPDASQNNRVQNITGECGAGVGCGSLGISDKDGALSVDMTWDNFTSGDGNHYAVPMRPAVAKRGRIYEYLFNRSRRRSIIDSRGRNVPRAQVRTNRYIRIDGFLLPTAEAFATNIEDLSVSYISGRRYDAESDRVDIDADVENQLAAILSGIARGG